MSGARSAASLGLARKALKSLIERSGGRIRTSGFSSSVERAAVAAAGGKNKLVYLVTGILSREVRRADILGFVPDGYDINEDEKRLILFEAEDTSYIGYEKWNKIDYLQAVAWELGWKVELVLIDRYGFDRRMDSIDIEVAAAAISVGEWWSKKNIEEVTR